jgi:L-cystine uptake protein TcyP (sodium:dicarboxylate symporter family)
MNEYQTKLEAIKAKRLSSKDRFQSLIVFIGMLFSALFALPIFGFAWTWKLYKTLLVTFPYDWMNYVSAVFCILLGLFVIFLIFYSISIGLNHFVRFLSGIKEK